jgi:hypothetical protein
MTGESICVMQRNYTVVFGSRDNELEYTEEGYIDPETSALKSGRNGGEWLVPKLLRRLLGRDE